MSNPNPETPKKPEPKADKAPDGWHPGTRRVDHGKKKAS